ncbi:MAG: GntR family transcriptional regulator [Phycisphaera sp.]|nr:GntR family transcriptional regulator [Phycisphaera sp.]
MTIAERIADDLERRVGQDRDVPEDWTLAALAELYGVSITPVREAVGALVDRDVLIRDDNGRVRVNPARLGSNPARRGASAGPASADALAIRPDDPTKAITDAVVELSITGHDEYLREEVAAERFGVGRTVVRRVFGELAGKGMLTHVPRCGWRVRPYRKRDMRDYLAVRETLELEALGAAWDRFDDAVLAEMLHGNRPATRGKSARIDNRLHRYWIELADNRYITDFFDRHGAYYDALFDHAAPSAERVSEMADQHRAILEALLARDRRAAQRALSRHIRSQAPVVAQMIERLHDAVGAPPSSTRAS